MARDEPLGPKEIEAAVNADRDPNDDLNTEEENVTRAEAALAMNIAGASWSDIARQLKYSSPRRARLAVERVLASTVGPEDYEQAREIQRRRYKRLLQSVMSKALDPRDRDHLAYNARALAITDRLGVLDGLNKPTQIQYTPTDQTIAEYIERIRPIAAAQNQAQEAELDDMGEIVDAESEG